MDDGFMNSVGGAKPGNVFYDAQSGGECCCTSAAIPAHGSFLSVGIKILHFEITINRPLEQDQSIRADAQPPVTEHCNLFPAQSEFTFAVVDENKVIPGTMIFYEID
jgi:hypothetical protein